MEVNMLLKNDRRPAFAYAASQGNSAKSTADKDFITRMDAGEDDFGNFASGNSAKDTKQPRKRQAPQRRKPDAPKPQSKNRNYVPFIFAGVAVVALIIIIALIASVFNSSNSSSAIEDNVYFSYSDSDKLYLVIEGLL